MMDLCGLQYSLPFPAAKTLAAQLLMFFLVEDTYHYWLHRAFHWGPLYRRIHRVHHQYAAPFGLTAEYASPWETLLLGFGTIGPPLVLGYFAGNVHLVTVLVWMTLRQVQAIDAHSGYDFPWSLRRIFPIWGGADWHDDHHRYFVGNYSSSFKHWDGECGILVFCRKLLTWCSVDGHGGRTKREGEESTIKGPWFYCQMAVLHPFLYST